MLLSFFLTGPARGAVTCPAHELVPADFQWGLVAYHVNLPGYDLHADDLERIAKNGIRWIRIDFRGVALSRNKVTPLISVISTIW